MKDRYFPKNVHIEDLAGGEFALVDSDLSNYEDAEICRFTYHGDIPTEMKRQFAEKIAAAINEYSRVLKNVPTLAEQREKPKEPKGK